jgi:hypothetical protein
MEIKNIELHTFEGVAVGRVFNFEDGNSISIEIGVSEVYDSDGSIYDFDTCVSGGAFIPIKEGYVRAIKNLGTNVKLNRKGKSRKSKIYALYKNTFDEELKLATKGVDFDPDSKKYLDSSNLAWKNTISRIEKTITKEEQL